ncbi:PD-(D/E)XK nuclease family protein [Candidatus Pacearchaeota archaeon]|nr:PD-(D/E)XK nuclease family protein [Candidatus Pacearchaeota archaeon]
MAVRNGKSDEKNGEKIFSHSRLWLYESCPEFYKLRYIDKLSPPIPTAMPLFLGTMTHEALEWLYHQVKHREVTVDELIEYFTENWIKNIEKEDVGIINGDEIDNYNKGIRFLVDYYTKNKPFNQKVIAIEHKILFPLDEEGKYKIQGFIDRLDLGEDGVYEVHDYKTNQSMKKKEDFEKDRQLAFYDIGLRETFGKDIKVRLIWHFLNFNQKIVSERNKEQLEKLKKDTLELVKSIENATEWPACGGKYCDWCKYKRENNITYEEFIKINNEVKKISLDLPDDAQFTAMVKK